MDVRQWSLFLLFVASSVAWTAGYPAVQLPNLSIYSDDKKWICPKAPKAICLSLYTDIACRSHDDCEDYQMCCLSTCMYGCVRPTYVGSNFKDDYYEYDKNDDSYPKITARPKPPAQKPKPKRSAQKPKPKPPSQKPNGGDSHDEGKLYFDAHERFFQLDAAFFKEAVDESDHECTEMIWRNKEIDVFLLDVPPDLSESRRIIKHETPPTEFGMESETVMKPTTESMPGPQNVFIEEQGPADDHPISNNFDILRLKVQLSKVNRFIASHLLKASYLLLISERLHYFDSGEKADDNSNLGAFTPTHQENDSSPILAARHRLSNLTNFRKHIRTLKPKFILTHFVPVKRGEDISESHNIIQLKLKTRTTSSQQNNRKCTAIPLIRKSAFHIRTIHRNINGSMLQRFHYTRLTGEKESKDCYSWLKTKGIFIFFTDNAENMTFVHNRGSDYHIDDSLKEAIRQTQTVSKLTRNNFTKDEITGSEKGSSQGKKATEITHSLQEVVRLKPKDTKSDKSEYNVVTRYVSHAPDKGSTKAIKDDEIKSSFHGVVRLKPEGRNSDESDNCIGTRYVSQTPVTASPKVMKDDEIKDSFHGVVRLKSEGSISHQSDIYTKYTEITEDGKIRDSFHGVVRLKPEDSKSDQSDNYIGTRYVSTSQKVQNQKGFIPHTGSRKVTEDDQYRDSMREALRLSQDLKSDEC